MNYKAAYCYPLLLALWFLVWRPCLTHQFLEDSSPLFILQMSSPSCHLLSHTFGHQRRKLPFLFGPQDQPFYKRICITVVWIPLLLAADILWRRHFSIGLNPKSASAQIPDFSFSTRWMPWPSKSQPIHLLHCPSFYHLEPMNPLN